MRCVLDQGVICRVAGMLRVQRPGWVGVLGARSLSSKLRLHRLYEKDRSNHSVPLRLSHSMCPIHAPEEPRVRLLIPRFI